MTPNDLYWHPVEPEFNARLAVLKDSGCSAPSRLASLRRLAETRVDFLQTEKIDRILRELMAKGEIADTAAGIKLAILATCTLDHLLPSIRVGALRRGLIADCYLAPYGQYWQEVANPQSGLHAFSPDLVLLSFDASSLVPNLPLDSSSEAVDQQIETTVNRLRDLWGRIKSDLNAVVVQQLVLDNTLPLFGNFEPLVPASPTGLRRRLNEALARAASGADVLVLDYEWWGSQLGARQVTDRKLWHHAKQEVSPVMAPLFGDVLARQLCAVRGLSRKCLVLDLDNTLWGGVVGDDGIEGLTLGQGSALGEAFLAFQHYIKRLSQRGVILAVSSKNDEAVARSAFETHPEMALGLGDIAVFQANWDDKASNLRRIAEELNLGLDALVFFDDNPAERDLVRRTLPEVAVPEVPEAVEAYGQCLADAGYFETTAFTADDIGRTQQVFANRERWASAVEATDIEGFLAGLEMEVTFGPFDRPNLRRVVQLINKTNQFNLTVRRYTEAEVSALMTDRDVRTLCVRLRDRFGDNGIISVVIGRLQNGGDDRAMEIETWLMSCRVLGRRVEEAVLSILAKMASEDGATALLGSYRPTERNILVRTHYENLGFRPLDDPLTTQGETRWLLPLASHQPAPTDIFKMVPTHG